MEENISSQNQIVEAPIAPAKPWLKIALFLVLGLVLVGGLVLAGVQIGKKQSQLPAYPTPALRAVATPTPVTVVPTQILVATPTLILTPTLDFFTNWKVYKNEKYGISFRYPQEWMKEGTPFENYNNPNRERGLKDECLINYSEGFSIKKDIPNKWYSSGLNADFNISVHATNPEKWNLEEWFKNCGKNYYENESDYQKTQLKIDSKDAILFSYEGDPGNGGIASRYTYWVENNHRIYSFSFQNHVFVEGAKEKAERLLQTVSFY